MARGGAVAWGCAAGALLASLALPTATSAVEVRYAVDALSHYVWRGITLTDDPVLQPSVAIAHASGFTFEAWANVDLTDVDETAGEIDETRLVFDYAHRFGRFELAGGLIEYLFPNTAFPGTREVHLRFAVDAVVVPKLELFYDIDEIDGGYARLSLAWSRDLGARWRLRAEAAAGWADASFAIGGVAGFHDGALELGLRRRSGAWELGLDAGWTESLDEQVLPDQPAHGWAGLSLAGRF